MARPSRTGGKIGKAKARKAGPSKGSKSARTSSRVAPAGTQVRRSSVPALSKDLKEAREQLAATAEIAKVIARSPGDVQPVLQAIAERTNQLVGGFTTVVWRILEGVADLAAFTHADPAADVALEAAAFRMPLSSWQLGETILKGEPFSVFDTEEGARSLRDLARLRGFRSMLYVPLLRDKKPIGMIGVTRVEPGVFADHHVQLLRTFADQAVIAIESVRLFDEVQARTREITEALEHQTAASEVLNVISRSPTDAQPVFEAIVESAARLCEAVFSVVWRYDGELLHYVASHNFTPEVHNRLLQTYPKRPDRSLAAERAVMDRAIAQVPDMLADPTYAHEFALAGNWRASVAVPILRDGVAVGAISVGKAEAVPFSERQIKLLTTFADQAVIAIENVRLFEELRKRTDDLGESLQQQTATADVLKVISSSPGELEPVFQAMLENAVRLCEAKFAMLFLLEAERFRAVGMWNLPPAYREFLETNAIRIDPKIPLGQVVSTRQPVQVADVRMHEAYLEGYPGMIGVAELGGARTLLQVPMLKEDRPVGSIGIYRQEVRPFTDKQVALVQNFAAQAVIAIENARLLGELRQRTDDLTSSLHDLRTTQDRLVQTEKLASLGQLTAGIAHEIKNPLNFVNNFSALSAELTEELKDVLKSAAISDKMREDIDELTGMLKDNLEKVVQHGKRADSIVKNMLLHSRQGGGELRAADINALVDESLNLAYHGARAENPQFNVTLRRNFDPAVGMFEVFPQEITRVLLNLISNGFYAVTRRKFESGGAGFEPVVSATTHAHAEHVEIRIRDNGAGIPLEVKEKIFNPFFTTKPAGEGTGLGLSMSHDIVVKQHGGRIDVDTESGAFTEFIVTLPRKRLAR
jgi:signal transduction histidine kinase